MPEMNNFLQGLSRAFPFQAHFGSGNTQLGVSNDPTRSRLLALLEEELRRQRRAVRNQPELNPNVATSSQKLSGVPMLLLPSLMMNRFGTAGVS